MRILALEPYYSGSHRAFLDGWMSHSTHDWHLLTLPAHHWKWRMRHAAVTFAELSPQDQRFDAVFCSDMLNLAEFRGLAPTAVAQLPAVVYFHENQLTYPVRGDEPRDLHFAFTNMTTALAAAQVWFNSRFHMDSFLAALDDLVRRMPDQQPAGAVQRIRDKSFIQPPGIEPFPPRGERAPGPMRILWAARWEHDKNPEMFFAAMRELRTRGIAFRLSVIGEQFRDIPDVFDCAQVEFADVIDRWGYQSSREAYRAALLDADVFVSTADHEFFGLSAVEAAAAGVFPLLPRRLAYPEVFGADSDVFYDGTVPHLVDRLAGLASAPRSAVNIAQHYLWRTRAPALDSALGALTPFRPGRAQGVASMRR
ncbi:MAG: DUF3524 domain-containing protein, partial [Phycisphaerales bacterium]|nr:DUF3524 domain-containing protein [Phycisphaerales bacterium]